MILTIAMILILMGMAGVGWIVTTRWSAHRHVEAEQMVSANGEVLMSLGLLLVLPVVLALPLPSSLNHPALWGTLLFGWGLVAARMWQRSAVLTPPAPAAPMTVPPVPWMPVLPSTPTSEGDTDGMVNKAFRWQYTPRDGITIPLEIALNVEKACYEQAKGEPRRRIGEWAHYARAESPEADQAAAAFYRIFEGRAWSSLEKAGCVLNFTQACIRYEPDKKTTPLEEWPRYPVETLMEEVGDCEDDVILTAAILKRLGWEVVLLYYPGHCALGVAGAEHLPGHFVREPQSGLSYFYGETTATGWLLGEVPERYRHVPVEGFEVVRRVVDSDDS